LARYWTSPEKFSNVASNHPMMPRSLASFLGVVCLVCVTLARAATAAEAEELYHARRYPEARAAFEQVIAAEPGNANAAYHLGHLALMRNAAEEAAKWLEQATALSPGSARYFRSLGDAYGLWAQNAPLLSRLGLARKSQNAYEKAVALDPEDLDARDSLLNFYRQAPAIAGGGLDKARVQAREIQKRDQLRGTVALVEISTAEKKYDEGFALLDDFLRLHPGALIAEFQYGWIAAMCGQRLDQGEAALRHYLAATTSENRPPRWSALWRLGQILEKKGDIAGARAEYDAALKLNPMQPQLLEASRRVNQPSSPGR
jgi:tetratricopeptide (TPR) repeat protein